MRCSLQPSSLPLTLHGSSLCALNRGARGARCRPRACNAARSSTPLSCSARCPTPCRSFHRPKCFSLGNLRRDGPEVDAVFYPARNRGQANPFALADENRALHCLKDGGQYFTGERHLLRGAVATISESAGAAGGDQGDGRQTRSARLPHAALRNEICGPRSGVIGGPNTANSRSSISSEKPPS